jgi:hypothetical protein
MPEWLHDRAKHILRKNPDMPEGEAFAIATQQAHALGKTPKSYGTPTGKHVAKEKYDTPGDDAKTAAWQDKIPGGLSDKKTPRDFPTKSLREGEKVEKEHTSDKHLQTEISMDHLTEDPHYYEKLKKMEDKTAAVRLAAFLDELPKTATGKAASRGMVASTDQQGNTLYTDPKDPDGGFWMFHGTSPKHIPSIIRHGLDPKQKPVNMALALGSMSVEDATKRIAAGTDAFVDKRKAEGIYLTPHRHYADVYGRIENGESHSYRAPALVATFISNDDLDKHRLVNCGMEYMHSSTPGKPPIAGLSFLHKGPISADRLRFIPPDEHADLVKDENIQRSFFEKKASTKEYVRVQVDGGLQHHYLNAEKWDHPAGKIEVGEAPEQAARRELIERTGYAVVGKLQPLGKDGVFHVFRAQQVKKVGPPQTEVRWQDKTAAAIPLRSKESIGALVSPSLVRVNTLPSPAPSDQEFGDEKESVKVGYSVSQYSGPLSMGRFKQESYLPPFNAPQLKTAGPPSEVGRVKRASEDLDFYGDSDMPKIKQESYLPPFKRPRLKTAAYHGSPTANISTLEPRLDPRTGKTSLFTSKHPEHAAIHALLADRATANITHQTKGGKFVSGHVVSKEDLLPHGYLYELPGSGGELSRATKPTSSKKVTLADAKRMGWTFEKKSEALSGTSYSPGKNVGGGGTTAGSGGAGGLLGPPKVKFSPGSQLARSQNVAKVPTTPPGPTVATIAKPIGYGRPMPGATKTLDA